MLVLSLLVNVCWCVVLSSNSSTKIFVEFLCFEPVDEPFECVVDCVHHGRVCRWLKVRRIK